jgi:hypothetical protein
VPTRRGNHRISACPSRWQGTYRRWRRSFVFSILPFKQFSIYKGEAVDLAKNAM